MLYKNHIADNLSANYLSIGCLSNGKCKKCGNKSNLCKYGGMFKFDDTEKLYKHISNNHNASEFCLVERRTEYFMLFFDLDVAEDVIEKDKMIELFSFIIENISHVLKYYIHMKKSQKELRYIYSDRSDSKINKLHLYYPYIVVNSHHALAIREKVIQNIMQDNKFNIDEAAYRKIIDDSVYKQSGIRLLFQKKPHEDGYYVINHNKSTYKNVSFNKYDQLLATSIRRANNCINIRLNMDENGCALLANDTDIVVNNFNKPKTNKTHIIRAAKSAKQNDVQGEEYSKLDLTIPLDMAKELFANLSEKRISEYSSWIRIVLLCRNYGLRTIAHDVSKRCKDKYNSNELDMILNNQSQHRGNPLTVGSLFEWSKEDNEANHKRIIGKYMVEGYYRELTCNRNDTLTKLKICESYSQPFARQLDYNKHNVIILKSPLGSNKSGECIKAIVELVEKYNYKKICCLASRVVLVSDLHERFNEPIYGEEENRPAKLNMTKYSDIINKSELYKYDRLIQTPDSLVNMFDEDGILDPPDILFADEIESILEYVALSDTLKSTRREVFVVLMEYIKKAKYVLLADGNVSKFVVKFIKKIRKEVERDGNDKADSFKLIYNKCSNDNNKYFFMKNEHEWSDQLDRHIAEGKKIFISTDSKDFSDKLYKHINIKYPKLKVGLYNSDTDDELKLNIGNVNKTWMEFDIVIISPTITFGVNMSAVYFDYVYAFYQTTIPARSVYQQLRRVRYIKSNEAYIYLKDEHKKDQKYYITEIKELAKYVARNKKEFPLSQNLASIYEDGVTLDMNDKFNRIYIFFLSERHKCNNNYLDELVYYITEYGGQVHQQIKGIVHSKDYINSQTELKEMINEERIDALMLAYKDIDKYDEVKFKPIKSYHDKNIILVNYILGSFGLNKIDREFLGKIKNVRNVDKFNESIIYFANKKYVDGYVKFRAKTGFPISLENEFKKINLIKQMIGLFWPNGILDNSIVTVYSNKICPTEKDKIESLQSKLDFFKENGKILKQNFNSLKRKDIPVNEYQMIGWVESVIEEYFGGFITIDISERKRKTYKKDTYCCYNCSIHLHIYIELFLNKYKSVCEKNILDVIKHTYDSKIICTYADLHKNNCFAKLYAKNIDMSAYMFYND